MAPQHSNARMFLPLFILLVALLRPAPAHALLDCLTSFAARRGATGAGDSVEIGAVRAAAEYRCDCDAFDGGGPDRSRRAFIDCTRGVVKGEVEAGRLRPACKSLVEKIYRSAVCGLASAMDDPAPCVSRRISSGAVRCAVTEEGACAGRAGRTLAFACLGFDYCLDAADTNGDLMIGPGDSGLCAVAQTNVDEPGFVEPHTPGSGDALEMPASPRVLALRGAGPDLNRVTFRRSTLPTGPAGPPRAVLILIPGFLGGGTSFEPIARDLVAAFQGALELWAVDRRPNQLEDRLGGLRAGEGSEEALAEGMQFYFADENKPPLEVFPGGNDSDVNGNGVVDARQPLEDALGVTRNFIPIEQDDMRFAAYWGLDTYLRDWRLLVDRARAIVGPEGLVLFGGHSLGTSYAGIFAAYDFDPGPGVDAGFSAIDGLLLLEGGGPAAPAPGAPDRDEYLAMVAALATPGGPNVYLEDLAGISPLLLGTTGEVAGLAGLHRPLSPALVQRTPPLNNPPLSLLLSARATNRAVFGMFLDDDFQPLPFLRASMGFSDNGFNVPIAQPPPADRDVFYLPLSRLFGLRTWKNFDDPGLPVCPPGMQMVSPGCAIVDNGPPLASQPVVNGLEREVSDIRDLLALQSGDANFVEWYFLSGRQTLDLAYGRDASALGDESLLAVTQNASVNVPVLCIGASNGLAPDPRAFADYLGSIATPLEDQDIVMLEGYAHIDVLSAKHNEAVPAIAGWIGDLLEEKNAKP